MEIGELSKSGKKFSALKLPTLAKKHVEMRSLHLALKLERNDLRIIKIAFLVLSKRFKRKKMLNHQLKIAVLNRSQRRF